MIIQRILDIIDYEGISKRKFYIKTGLSNGFLDKVKDIGASKIEIILSKYPNINPIWLITGKGEMVLNDSTTKAIKATTSKSSLDKYQLIPLVKMTVAGGFGSESFTIREEDVKEYYVIPKFKHKKIDFMIEVRGDSMSPSYGSGDIVACTIIRSNSFLQWNKIHVIATKEQGILIKRIKESIHKDHLQMISENPDYSPFDIPEDEITGIALVAGGIKLE